MTEGFGPKVGGLIILSLVIMESFKKAITNQTAGYSRPFMVKVELKLYLTGA